MDDSAYPDEKEVIITDGCAFQVLSVYRQTILEKDLVIIKLLADEGYYDFEL
jgi:hypothetical protein